MKKRILAVLMICIMTIGLMVFPGIGLFKAGAAQTFERVEFINGVVIADRLNLRSGPSTEHEIIGKFTKNKWLNVLAKIGDWYVVFDPDSGKVGCVSAAYFKTAPEVNQGKTSTPAPSKPSTPASPSPAATPVPSTDKQEGDLSPDEKKLLDLINAERAKSNLSPLIADPELMKVARIKANDMTKNNYFSHYSPTYGSPFDMMRQFGITFKAAAENIAGNSTIEGAVSSWMKSEGHRSNIMNSNYNYTGIGISKSNKYGYVFVQMFIRK
ncbi:MAG: SH3 domain-containing protein [Clostridiaceae bacterium]|nr:SH3 domain-containing protein [Clostridiaceae bacterium]